MLEAVAVLVKMIKERGSFVLHTGAGFSTAAAIPDFRGRNGVWTMQAKGKAVPMPRFECTTPTRAHLAAVALHRAGYLTHVITQNVDGLHQRAGLPRDIVSELHGSVYREECRNEDCAMAETPGGYLRTFDVTATKPHNGRHRHKTGRQCDECGGDLHDTVVQFGEHLDDDTLEAAIEAATSSPLSLVLGTSLKVPPASTLPRRSGALVVCNLQWTSQDKHAALKIHAKCDQVMLAVCAHLGVEVPEYDAEADPVGRAVLAAGGAFASPNVRGGDTPAIENAAVVYGGRGGARAGTGEGGKEGTSGHGPGEEDDGDTYASPETWAGGRRDARVLFGEADGGKTSRRRSGAAIVKKEREEEEGEKTEEGVLVKEEEAAPEDRFVKLSKKARKMKKPCMPRPNIE